MKCCIPKQSTIGIEVVTKEQVVHHEAVHPHAPTCRVSNVTSEASSAILYTIVTQPILRTRSRNYSSNFLKLNLENKVTYSC
jgi:hypothetical protein